MVTDLAKLGESDRTKGMQAMLYKYDQLHRITKSRSLTNYSEAGGFAARTANAAAYDETYTYDGNGNILTLDRMNGQGGLMDDFDYYYYKGTNKLRGVLPVVRDTTYNGAINSNNKLYRDIMVTGTARPQIGTAAELRATRNIEIQNDFEAEEGNDFAAYIPEDGPFVYDAIGNLIADQEEGSRISWTPYGKVREVKTKNDSVVVRFRYDATGNRIEKRLEKYDTTLITRYVRDASGNVMAIYNDTTVTERPIYGSSRLGIYKGEVLEGNQTLGRRNYELSNHLGNVLTVITDNIYMHTSDTVKATVVSTSDYYPFGLDMKERSWSDSTSLQSRYGFNGKEKDDGGEWSNTAYDYGFRIYDPSIARFLSVDPLTKSYPAWSPYAFAMNRPIDGVDLDGLEWSTSILSGQTGSSVHVINKLDVKIRVVNQSKIVLSQPDVDLTLNNVKQEAEKDFKSIRIEKDEDNDVIEESVLNITFDQTPLGPNETLSASTGFFMVLEDQKTTTNPVTGNQELVAGSSIPGYVPGYTQHNIVHLAVTVDGVKTKPNGYSRAGTHELGHSGGLPHPWMASENAALNIKDADQSNKANKQTVKSNLMNSDENPVSGMGSTKGTQVTQDQIRTIIQTVSKQQPKQK